MTLIEWKTIGEVDASGELAALSDSERDRIEKVKARVMKLLTKAKGEGATQAEREEAMEFAAKFARHAGLELYEIEREMGKQSTYVLRKMKIPGHAKWQYQLAASIAQALIVRLVLHHEVVLSTKPNKRTGNRWRNPLADYVSLVGTEGDIELVDYLFDYIVRELTKLAKVQYKIDSLKAELAWDKPANPKRWHDNFYRGAVSSLSVRLDSMFKAEERELQRRLKVRELAETKLVAHEELTEEERAVLADETLVAEARTMALVPLKDAEVKAARDEFFPKLGKGTNLWQRPNLPSEDKVGWKKAREAEATRKNAYMAGRRAGADLELRGALNGRTTAMLEGAAS